MSGNGWDHHKERRERVFLMTYTFKLARRLAVSRDLAMLAILAVVAACTGDTTTAPDGAESSPSQAAILRVSPRIVTAETNQAIRFRGHERSHRGETILFPTVWSSDGGTITANGTFSSSLTGTFKVIGRGRGRKQADTAVVVVVPPATDVTRLVVAPDATTLEVGAGHTFAATAYLADGSTTTVGVNWSATGGEIDAAGAYTAGMTAGTFKVIAANTDGTLADTAAVAIEAPAPAPEPTLTNVYVTPASASVGAGATQAFKAYGRNSAGDSVPVTVTFTATGGSVTSSGLYTAGTTGGTFRLIAKESTTGAADTSAVTVVAASGVSTAVGIPFGPFGLWSSYTSVKWGPTPFTTSQNYTDPAGIVTQIATARSMHQKLVLAMTGGPKTPYQTNGNFDLAKWKARMDLFNTSTIKSAVAAGVADGTIIGNSLIDEPEHALWGTGLNKSVLNGMATYAKQYFPTLPMGVNHGANAYYTWRTGERYTSVDYVQNNYVWYVTNGDVAAYRDKVLAQARLDGVGVGFSLNILDGGVKIAGCTSGTACCPLTTTGGIGTFAGAGGQNCRMTAANVRDWGRVLGVAGCMMLMWRYDDAFASDPNNVQAFKDVAVALAGAPSKACRRP
jgi:hypothetical protein